MIRCLFRSRDEKKAQSEGGGKKEEGLWDLLPCISEYLCGI